MIELASFSTLHEANAYADLLRRAGIMCKVEAEGWEGELNFGQNYQGPYLLLVQEADEEDAAHVLETADPIEALSDPPGQRNMLVGGVVAGVGILTSLGSMPGVEAPWSWIPYGLAAVGISIFLKGVREERDAG